MTALRTAAQQALEALKVATTPLAKDRQEVLRAVAALKAALSQQEEPVEPVAWSGYDLDGMVEAFSRVIEAHYQRANPFQNPIDMDAQMALRILRGFIPAMKAYAAPPRCPNCASLEAQNTELDRKLAELDQDETAQEPVAWMVYTEGGTSAYVTDNPHDLVGAYRALPLYTAPPKDEPKPMHPELRKMWEDYFDKCFRAMPVPKQAEPVEPVAGRAFLERILAAMEGVIDVADRKTDEFDALRSCVIDLTLMLHTAPPQRKPLTDEEILAAVGWERAEMYMKLTPNFPVAEAKKETLKNARAIERAHGIGETK